ncbi:MAG: hypothetical protein J4G19_00120 [Pseudomonadales bacterium]|nr:hypothetical protein [Pseudomonadales bacterium]
MAKRSKTNKQVEHMDLLDRRRFLRGLCPCRTNSSDDIEGWKELFNRARYGSYSERRAAAHSIGTLLGKAQQAAQYRELLLQLKNELDALMDDRKSASDVLGVMKKHGHAHKGAARKNYRRAYSVFAIQTPTEVANWLNERLALKARKRVTTDSKIVRNLARWLEHRTTFQPTRKTSEDEIIERARQLQPSLFSA